VLRWRPSNRFLSSSNLLFATGRSQPIRIPSPHSPESRPDFNAVTSRTWFSSSATEEYIIQYAKNFGDKAKLALPPARRFAILTCMDARLDPAKYAGLAEGALTLNGSTIFGVVRSVREERSSGPPRWIVTIIPMVESFHILSQRSICDLMRDTGRSMSMD
jgi:hypothetical protein